MTTRNCSNLSAITDTPDDAGITYTIGEGRHLRVRWIAGGQTRMIIVSRSGSDCRAEKNARCMVRRMLRQDGLLA